jgi:hypothetical protein
VDKEADFCCGVAEKALQIAGNATELLAKNRSCDEKVPYLNRGLDLLLSVEEV